jgi:hypothetical protein
MPRKSPAAAAATAPPPPPSPQTPAAAMPAPNAGANEPPHALADVLLLVLENAATYAVAAPADAENEEEELPSLSDALAALEERCARAHTLSRAAAASRAHRAAVARGAPPLGCAVARAVCAAQLAALRAALAELARARVTLTPEEEAELVPRCAPYAHPPPPPATGRARVALLAEHQSERAVAQLLGLPEGVRLHVGFFPSAWGRPQPQPAPTAAAWRAFGARVRDAARRCAALPPDEAQSAKAHKAVVTTLGWMREPPDAVDEQAVAALMAVASFDDDEDDDEEAEE